MSVSVREPTPINRINFADYYKDGILNLSQVEVKSEEDLLHPANIDFLQRQYNALTSIFFANIDKSFVKFLSTRQQHICDQLVSFLNIIAAPNDFILEVKGMGLCQGLSICYAVMKHIGKLNWWEAALRAVLAWDGKQESLQKDILLPEADNNLPVSLFHIIQRVLNYVYFQQGMLSAIEMVTFQQSDIWQHVKVVVDGRVESIKKKWSVAGNFNEAKFAELLDENKISECMCMVYSSNHLVVIDYDKQSKKWKMYDPNMYHLPNLPTAFSFLSKKELTDFLYGKLKPKSLAIQLVSFKEVEYKEENPFAMVDKWIEKDPWELIKADGFHMAAFFAPEVLKKILIQIHALGKIGFCHTLFDGNNKYYWHSLAESSDSELFIQMMKWVSETQNGSEKLAQELILGDSSDWTAWHFLVRNRPQLFPRIFKQARDIPAVRASIAKAFLIKTNDGWTVWHLLARYAPEHLLLALQYAAKLPWNLFSFFKNEELWYAGKNGDGWTVWMILARNHPSYFIDVFHFAVKNHYTDYIFESMKAKNKGGWNMFSFLKTCQPIHLSDIVHCIKQFSGGEELILFEFPEGLLPLRLLPQ